MGVTYASYELLFGDEFGLVVVELLEESFSPVSVLVEEEEEVFEADHVVCDSLGDVFVHQVENGDFIL